MRGLQIRFLQFYQKYLWNIKGTTLLVKKLQKKKAQFYMYFPTKLSCQTHHNSILEHEHKKPHPKKCIPEAVVRTSSSPSMGMISTTSEEMRPSAFNASEGCEKYDSILQTKCRRTTIFS
ncbi:hypothetical protein CDAR_493391 [Caerostris darwini]|uniref:Uncharacterized protein n=1 Tax=Caerostris darwini TaxID=1538125 RepID=A0AAV4QDZ9_9ARAC|nr:hypothetical protein CDAR_493391 [Caerostris darwini]